MDAEDDFTAMQIEGGRDLGVIDLDHLLDFEVMISGAQRAHLIALARLGLFGNLLRVRAGRTPALLGALQVAFAAVALRHRPARTCAQHRVHLPRVETQRTGTAHTGRNAEGEIVGQCALEARELLAPQPRVQRAHAAGNVEADPARRDHSALQRDRKPPPRQSESRSPSVRRAWRRRPERCPAAPRRCTPARRPCGPCRGSAAHWRRERPERAFHPAVRCATRTPKRA